MPNPYFRFKKFTIYHDRCAMKVTTDACLFGAWVADAISHRLRATMNGNEMFSHAPLLDIGTGTGLLSLMVAQKNNLRIEALEIDGAAAEQASENIATSPWREQVVVLHQDVITWQTAKQYELIVSNPPFYQNDLRSAKTERNVAHHDEGLPLPDLFSFIAEHLAEKGSFYLLLPVKRQNEVHLLMKRNGLFLQQEVLVQQTLKHPPFRWMIQGRRKKVDLVTESVIVIKNEAGQYTSAFQSLLKDYYLYL